MATALQQQLATIAANSTHQLDLKAQKARHSKSLLFEPRDAATQSFDTIFQICYEGFDDLCQLDVRFLPFARNLFSEQSKNEDRTQMTAKENQELDKMVEAFLGLVSARLLLKPAMKAVEWLVRRFRIQEYNTEAILLTFLPYHSSHIFPTLLSILPDQLPATFKWLHPYVASLQTPPRHAVLSAAIGNPGFFSAFSQYTLRVARAKHQSAVVLGFWASITAQAVNGMIDATRSGRDTIRKQREEDLLLRVLPVLQSALSIKGVPELYLGACMILTILATKTSPDDKVLDAMMEAVTGAWTQQTMEDGMMCLAVIAEEKQRATQPKAVTRTLLNTDGAVELLVGLAQRNRTDKLVLGTALGALDLSTVQGGKYHLTTARCLMRPAVLPEHHLTYVVESALTRAGTAHAHGSEQHQQQLINLIGDLAAEPDMAAIVEQAARKKQINLQKLSPQLALALPETGAAETEEDSEPMDVDEDESSEQSGLNAAIAALPELDKDHPSFLDPANDTTFHQFASVFAATQTNANKLSRFLQKKALQRNKSARTPTYLSFLARCWSSSASPACRARALELAIAQLQGLSPGAYDMQVLFPCAICALQDDAPRVRKAAGGLCATFLTLYRAGGSKDKVGKDVTMWGPFLYGPRNLLLQTLPPQDAYKVLSAAFVPVLEDCVLDSDMISRALSESLNASRPKAEGGESKELKASIRSETCTSLASHVAATPCLRVKLALLKVLGRVGKAASEARKSVLLPFVKEWVARSSEQVEAAFAAEQISSKDLEGTVIGCLSHRSADELDLLKSIAAHELGERANLSGIAFGHLRKLWTAMKGPSQTALVDFLLDLTVKGAERSDTVSDEALDTLRNLHYSSEVLVHMVETLPSASDLQDQPSSAKKQRTTKSEMPLRRKTNPTAINAAIRRITLVLELVEASKPERHAALLQGLFHLLGELHHYKALAGSQLVYLQGLLMGCLLSVVTGLNAGFTTDVDRSVIRADLIVECVRTTSSTQVHNTALLLISNLASWAPELVLHSVMPLFTFMSTTLLRQSDEYSAHVTDQTVARIVPPLAESLKKRGRDLVSGAAELLLSFTAAFEHIPLHRRPGLFQHLVQTLGPEESLFAVVAMIVERYPKDSRVQPFVSDLMDSFSVEVQLHAFQQYLDLVADTMKPKPSLANTILAFSEKDTQQASESVETLLDALTDLMESPRLRKRIAKTFGKGGKAADSLRATYARLLDQTMQLNRAPSSNPEFRDHTNSLLNALLGLTPTKDFIDSSSQLMQTGSDYIRQQVFRSLEARVAQAKQNHAEVQKTFIEVLPNCCAFIVEAQPVETRRTAITCIDQIVDKFGKVGRAAVTDAALVVSGPAALGSKDASLQVASLLCLASMVETLGDEFISILPQALDKAMVLIAQSLSGSKIDYALHNAGFRFATAVLDNLPWMFSAQYLDRALVLAANTVAAVPSREHDLPVMNDFRSIAPRKIGASELFSALDRTWDKVIAFAEEAIREHLELLHTAVKHYTKAAITKSSQTLFAVVLKAFDIPRIPMLLAERDDQRPALPVLIDTIALDMTLKLNDATFRPFFIRFVEWAAEGSNPKKGQNGHFLRAASLYSFAHLLFEQLKSIVTSYAGYLLDHAAGLLKSVNGDDEHERLVLVELLQTLSSSFRYDQDAFWQAPAHLEIIAMPLLAQLKKAENLDVTKHVIPAITDLTAAAGSPEHHKTINATIMAYMKHEDAAVRLAAVQCERSILGRLTLEWIGVLPEMLPLISELQEDDSEAVEQETLRLVADFDLISGQNVQDMLH